MTLSSGNTYTTTIGPFSEGQTVSYYILALDDASQETQSSSSSFTVTDSSGPTITSLSPEDGSTITERKPKISASYSDNSGIHLDSVKLSINGVDVTSDSSITSSLVTYMSDSDMPIGFYSIKLEIDDALGNSASVEWTFQIMLEGADVIKSAGDFISGETKDVSYEETESVDYVGKIKLTASGNLENVQITLKEDDDPPEGVSTPTSKNIYMYLSINTNQDESNFTEAIIEFKVEKSWFKYYNIDEASIILLRFHDGKWVELKTTEISDDGTYKYYEAKSEGFSTFAIVGTKIKSIVQPSINWYAILGGVVVCVILIIAILFKLGYFYFEKDESNGKDVKKGRKK
jgi:PGF-pre-PGF domain-containing protein